ncbi:ubiquinone-dependent pyruvate dehydrogenase [Granulicoccus phenolivorans]|uniref:ubiquinone-dependent pyruvate dehydrogenase n=1 Tax=Granulicoccus phenolivorans TaxID=266854 RepID=UPI00042507FF|nr:ubiquinone-dependent pyruvate dehydrogenase [Granulicoccus phenolivorans]
MVSVAENLIRMLSLNGVRRVYGVPGDSLNAITESLRTHHEIEWVHVRHEETAAFAAGAEAEMSGELAVCAGSCGPGNLHLINGLYDAQRSRVPVLALAAHIPTSEIGTGYFQETHPQELFRECSVYVEYVADPKQLPRLLEVAMRAAIERRGVAVLVIPGDVASAEAQDTREVRVTRARSTVVPVAADLGRAAAVLNAAGSVTILGGAGTAGAHREVLALAERLQAPIVHAMRGKDHLEYDNPYDVGMTGLLGFSSGYKAMWEAEAILMLGTDFPYPQFFPDSAQVIQVDLRGEQIGKRHPVEVALVGGVAETATALLPLLEPKKDHHLQTALKHYAKTREKLDDLATPARRGAAVHPQYLAQRISALAADDAVFIPDVGSPVVYAARYLKMNGRRRLLGSFSHGSMANAVPQAIGVLARERDRQTVTLSGDGGLTMLLGELLTLVQMRLPAKVVVFNNSSLNFVELEMKAAGIVPFATDLDNPDFAAVARAMGIKGIRVESSEDVDAALSEAFAYDGPALVDVVTDPQELTIPPTIQLEQAKGFALYTLRTVMSGRGDELIDLARTNLRQLF